MKFEKEIEFTEVEIDDIVTLVDREEKGIIYTFKVGVINSFRGYHSLFPYSMSGVAPQEFPMDEWKILNRSRIHRNIILEDAPRG